MEWLKDTWWWSEDAAGWDPQDRWWSVLRRYSEFVELYEDLDYGDFELSPLPPKGIFGFRNRFDLEEFRQQRQEGLQDCLQDILR